MKSTQRTKIITSTPSTPSSARLLGRLPSMMRRGTGHKQAKLTEKHVYQIRKAFDKGTSTRIIADRFGISVSHACSIGKRREWAWLPEEGAPSRRLGA